MWRVIVFLAWLVAWGVDALASAPEYVYEGEFELKAYDIAVAPNGELYMTAGPYVHHSTATGSHLGWWGGRGSRPGQFYDPLGIAVAPNGNVYVADAGNCRVQYFTPTGDYLGEWAGRGVSLKPRGVDVASNGNVYVCFSGEYRYFLQYFTSRGSYLGLWNAFGKDVAISPSGNVYVSEVDYLRIRYFTPTGSYLGWWPTRTDMIAVGPDGTVFCSYPHRIRYFTSNGSALGRWGSEGSGPGEFIDPYGVAVSPSGARVYVADNGNSRVQYFRRSDPAVAPASLGKVKALFK
jgi:tripartite motif-containing protein 71